MGDSERGRGESLPRLVGIMQRLLGPGGCPWDRAQTFESLRPYVIEEAFEVVDAIDGGSADHLREELGDLLMQFVFLSELARREGWFGPDDAIAGICDKLERRHPHVFGDADAGDAATVERSWEAIKRAEKGGRGVLEGVPVAMPALSRAVRLGEKAARVGYDWPDAAGARAKVDEELAELDRAVVDGDDDQAARELGDLLFALSSWARKRRIDPEAALRGALRRFSARFEAVEARAAREGVGLESLDEAELDRRWEQAKRALTPPEE
ncbi:MAG TPA: nucleoside triphosphate pyrophosphohydrolase [Sandaracinaceae bacterium LLY-WYZ-13_1]|nr:nucleoside triphosphate pyrophosphohydrolase [Sandaracinaceae bacterium LLY-WYZ-13_1]